MLTVEPTEATIIISTVISIPSMAFSYIILRDFLARDSTNIYLEGYAIVRPPSSFCGVSFIPKL